MNVFSDGPRNDGQQKPANGKRKQRRHSVADLAIASQRMFNLMHLESAIKVDIIVRKDSAYRRQEFARRRAIDLGGVATWIVSREDLILSKLVWSLDSRSEMQLRDVRSLMDESTDWIYLQHWAPLLDVATLLDEVRK